MSDRPQKEITLEYLKRASLFHLQKFDTTSGGLTKVLQRRVYKRCYGTDCDPSAYTDMISEAVMFCVERGYIDNARYTERFVERSMEKGVSRTQVTYKLGLLGIPNDDILAALEKMEFSEFDAAEVYARKRKIGKFRAGEQDKYRQKDMAALARKGFSYDICSKLVSGDLTDGDF